MEHMKKKMLIASFFAILMLVTPLTVAFSQSNLPGAQVYGILSKKKLNSALSGQHQGNGSGGNPPALPGGMMQLNSMQLVQLDTAIDSIEDIDLRNNIQSIFDQIITPEGQINITDLELPIGELTAYCISLHPDGEIDDIFDLIIWIIQALIEYIITGSEELINEVYAVIVSCYNLIGIVIEDIKDIFEELADPGTLQDLLLVVVVFGGHLIDFITNATSIPSMIIQGIKDIVVDTTRHIFAKIWEFCDPRLGYVGDFVPYILGTLLQYGTLKNDIETKLERIKIIFVELPRAYLNFTGARGIYLKLQRLVGLGVAIGAAVTAAIDWLADVLDGEREIIDGVTAILNNLTWLRDYFNSEPWKEPIHIYGVVENATGDVTVSCTGDSDIVNGDGGQFSIYYETANLTYPCLLHEVEVKATSSEKTITRVRPAFSNGGIYLYIDFSEGGGGGHHVPGIQKEILAILMGNMPSSQGASGLLKGGMTQV